MHLYWEIDSAKQKENHLSAGLQIGAMRRVYNIIKTVYDAETKS